MVVVFDASVLVKLFLAETYSDVAVQLVSDVRVAHVPDLVRVEVAGAITRAARRNTISIEEATVKLQEWEEFSRVSCLRYTMFQELMNDAKALSLQLKHPLADCLYLALAQRLTVEFVTADEPLSAAAAGFVPNVRLLREFLN